MSFFKPNYSNEQKAAMKRGIATARKVDAFGAMGAAKAVGKAAGKAVGKMAVKKALPYGGEFVRKVANTSGKRIGTMKLPGQKRAVKIFRRYTQGFD